MAVIQGRRTGRPVPNVRRQKPLELHDYANAYVCPRNPLRSRRGSTRRSCSPAPGGGLLNLNNWRGRTWAPAIEPAGAARPARIYDLRNTFASDALAAGVSIFTLAKIMGTSVRMIERHNGALLDGGGAAIAGALGALDAERDRAVDCSGKTGERERSGSRLAWRRAVSASLLPFRGCMSGLGPYCAPAGARRSSDAEVRHDVMSAPASAQEQQRDLSDVRGRSRSPLVVTAKGSGRCRGRALSICALCAHTPEARAAREHF
jgi:hypothetical protein